MMYLEIIKKDPKGFVIKSPRTHITLNARIYKLIKYKEYFQQVHIFYKENGKVYQRYISKYYFDERSGTPKEIFEFILNYKKILAYRYLRKLGERYLRRFYE